MPQCDSEMAASPKSKNSAFVPSHRLPDILTPPSPQNATLRHEEENINGIKGENDFSGKQWVWLRDPRVAFVRGYVAGKQSNGHLLVECDDGSV